MINGNDFSKIFAKKYNVNNKNASAICNGVFELLAELLYIEKEDVTIYKFGSFKHKASAEKKARHPGTGEIITIPERDVIKFKQTESINKNE